MRLVHLTASTYFGGPERQMLGLGQALPDGYRSTFASFSERGRCRAFLDRAAGRGFAAVELRHDTPRLRAALREITTLLRDCHADTLITHGYKSNLLGRLAARRCGIPVIAVSRGWTAENVKVRVYEAIDRFHLRYMDAVVCVSAGQAWKVRRAGVPGRKLTIIRNAARLNDLAAPDPEYQRRIRALCGANASDCVVVAAGRLSPEKGFQVLAEAAAWLPSNVRIVHFGDGPLRGAIENRLAELGRRDRLVLAGFRDDLDRWLPCADLVVLPSFTEGLPNVVLEASAAGVPVVATAVGGTPEAVRDGETGLLVPSGDPRSLADAIATLCGDPERRAKFGAAGRRFMEERFSFPAQAEAYVRLLREVASRFNARSRGVAC